MQLVVFLLLLSISLDGSDGASGWRSQDRKPRPRHRLDDDVAKDGFVDCQNVSFLIADIYISISMGTFEHRKYKTRGENGNN